MIYSGDQKILGTAYGYLPLTVKMCKNPQRRQKIHDICPTGRKDQ